MAITTTISEELDSILKSVSRSHGELNNIAGEAWDESTIAIRDDLRKQLSNLPVRDRYTTRLRNRLLNMHVDNPIALKDVLAGVMDGKTGVKKLDLHMNKLSARAAYHQQVLPKVNELAKHITGFKDEDTFRDFCEIANSNHPRLKAIFKRMSDWVKKHPSAIIKSMLLVGVGAPFLARIKQYQIENTGCFVYDISSDKEGVRRQKIPTRSCMYLSLEGEEISHPLDGISWDCKYNVEFLQTRDKWGILDAGCKAICDPHNYNKLAPYAPGYDSINLNLLDKLQYYRCERSTLLHSIAVEAGNIVYDVATGFTQSMLGSFFPSFQSLIFYSLMFLLLLLLGRFLLRSTENIETSVLFGRK